MVLQLKNISTSLMNLEGTLRIYCFTLKEIGVTPLDIDCT